MRKLNLFIALLYYQMNTPSTVKIGLIGLGHLGKIHLQQLLTISSVTVIGVYDAAMDHAKAIAEEFGVAVFDDADDLIRASDAIDIVTPTHFHYYYAEKAIKNFKHVFIEKPVTENLTEAKKLIELATEANIKAQVGHVERFNPAFLALKEMALTPQFIEVHRLAPFNPRGNEVPVVLDLMIHDIDIIMSLIKSDIKRVSANGVGIINESSDIANARIEFANGAAANLTASRISMKKMRKMRIFQPNKYLTIDFLDKRTEIYSIEPQQSDHEGLDFENYKGEKKKLCFDLPEIAPVNAIQYELQLFAESILTSKETAVNLTDGYVALKVAYEILKKIEKN